MIACPTGGAEVAHQIVNTGTIIMHNPALSAVTDLETCEYPDSGKFSVVAGKARRAGCARFFAAPTMWIIMMARTSDQLTKP